MRIDKELMFADEQAILDDGQSENVVALGPNSDIGNGEPVYLRIECKETYSGGTGTKVTINLRSSAAVGMGSPVIVQSTGEILAADLVAGEVLYDGPVQRGTLGFCDLDLAFDNAFTAGKISAWLGFGQQAWEAKPGNTGR